MVSVDKEKVDSIVNWLIEGVPGATSPADVIDRLAPAVRDAGIPLDRVEAFVRTLHPHIVGRSFVWSPGGKVEVRENSWAYFNSSDFLRSPVSKVFQSGQALRCRLDTPAFLREYSQLEELARDGFKDYFVGPLVFLTGQAHAVTFGTRDPKGFSPEQLAVFQRILIPLSRIAEIFALHRTATNLLNAYVGHGAGERILAGQIVRGDTQLINAVIWVSDLRSFTPLAEASPPREIIGILNDLFDCQVPSIDQNKGEVLKFMGDGLLAIFAGESRDACDRALRSAKESREALQKLNLRRTSRPLEFGVALHVGEVAYGNIGGSGRLDFTCIGPAVNLSYRLEGLTSKLEQPILLSEEFARLTSFPVKKVGAFPLKGLAQETNVFCPA